MELIFHAISFILVALIALAAFTIGFSLLIWLLLVSICITIVLVLRQYYLRWRFLRENRKAENVIEGVYREINDHKP